MSQKEVILFDKGINKKKSPLFLSDGESYSIDGFNLDITGELNCRNEVNATYLIDSNTNFVNGIYRYQDSLLASSNAPCPGGVANFDYFYQRDASDTSWTNIARLLGSDRPSMVGFEKFIFAVNGEQEKAFIDEKPYKWGVDNPDVAPILTAGAGGNPNGEYFCYVTYYVTFPNDKSVETGPSPVATITVTSTAINWSRIPVCKYSGEGILIKKRLWRTVSGITYLVTTIDNEQTTYTDDATDEALQLASELLTEGFSTPPKGMTDITSYLQRIFGIKDNRLYWSESYAPFSFNPLNNVVVTKDGENLVSVFWWGDQIFLVSTETWRRLQGNDPDTWAIKNTFADTGTINKNTLKITKHGVVSLWHDGLYIFDGSLTKNITERILGAKYFTNVSDWSTAYAEYDGQVYHLYFDSDGDGILDKCLKIDMIYYPDLRCYNSDFVPSTHYYYRESGINYFAFDGYEYSETGSETISASAQSKDMAFGDVTKKKNLEYLYYDINTNGKDVTVRFYVDNVDTYNMTLNESSRHRKRSPMLPNIEGYKFSIKIECSDSADLVIYGPWAISATLVGD